MFNSDNYADIEAVMVLIDELVNQGKTATVAALVIRLQMDYLNLATLSTDGEYDPNLWTHKDVMNFLTKGDIK